MPKGNGDVKRTRVKRRIDLHIPVAALSTNKLYGGVKKRSWHYKKFRKQIFRLLAEMNKGDNVRLDGNLVLKLEVGVSSPLSDLSNTIKGIEDVLADFYDFNDRQIIRIEMDKYLVPKGREYMKVSIHRSRKNIDRRMNAN